MRAILLAVLLLPPIVMAQSNKVPLAYKTLAEAHLIPADIVYAVALTESGYSRQSIYNPWPWTLNIDGQAYRFKNRQYAYQQLIAAIQKKQSVDIGIMQINWYWHRQRFNDVWSALDPIINVETGITILREQYRRSKNWWLAIGHYHAPGDSDKAKKRAAMYRHRVYHQWQKINKSNMDMFAINDKGATL